jgi:hypothetical protein
VHATWTRVQVAQSQDNATKAQNSWMFCSE